MVKPTHPEIVSWRGHSASIEFDADDFEVVDQTLNLIPELRICALAAKRARHAKLRYPVENVEQLVALLDGKSFSGGGHDINADLIRRFMPEEFFPITHEGELISRAYIALLRCVHELRIADSTTPPVGPLGARE